MPKVQLNTAAPDFKLEDFRGEPFQLSQLQGKKNVVLVFNRGFM